MHPVEKTLTSRAAVPSPEFSLDGRGLKLDSAEDMAQYLDPLMSNNNVTSIQLRGNTLGVGACEALAQVLCCKTTLEEAKLSDIFTSRLVNEIPPALDALVDAMLQLPNLHTVDLSDNAFGLMTCAPLERFLSNHTPLEHLYLNNNGLGPIAGERVADALIKLAKKKQAAQTAKPLRTVICGRNRLENGSMKAWAKAYQSHPHVQTIKMVQNGIRADGIESLFKGGLKYTTGLRVLELEDNTFTRKGSQAFASILSGLPQLEVLNLSDCYLSQRGFESITSVLKTMKHAKLQLFKACFGNITPAGIKSLADSLYLLPAVQRIELNGNRFEEDDASLVVLRKELDKRRVAAGEDDKDSLLWGLGDLDELEGEEDDSDEEDEQEEEDKLSDEEDDDNDKAPLSSNADKEDDGELAKTLDKLGI